MAQFMVQNKLTADMVNEKGAELSFPSSVVEYFQGYLGEPPGGYPEPLRTKVRVLKVWDFLASCFVTNSNVSNDTLFSIDQFQLSIA